MRWWCTTTATAASGWSLSWGSATMAVRKAMATQPARDRRGRLRRAGPDLGDPGPGGRREGDHLRQGPPARRPLGAGHRQLDAGQPHRAGRRRRPAVRRALGGDGADLLQALPPLPGPAGRSGGVERPLLPVRPADHAPPPPASAPGAAGVRRLRRPHPRHHAARASCCRPASRRFRARAVRRDLVDAVQHRRLRPHPDGRLPGRPAAGSSGASSTASPNWRR